MEKWILDGYDGFKRGDIFKHEVYGKVILGGYSRIREGFNAYQYGESKSSHVVIHALIETKDLKGMEKITELLTNNK